MRNLTTAQASLANLGQILPELKRKSPVHYWQTSKQHRSRQEAICEKGNNKWHITTFGSHDHWAADAAFKCNQAARWNRNHVDSCQNHSLMSLPEDWKREHGIRLGTLGVGYWRWKPYTILRRLEAMDEGEVLLHADYDLILGPNLHNLFCLGQNVARGVAAFHFPCLTDRAWTKAEAAQSLNASARVLDTAQIYAGLLVLRKTAGSMRFVKEWLRLSLQDGPPNLISDDHDTRRQDRGFMHHRHDQSLLSILVKQHRHKTFPMPTKSHDVRDVWAWDAGYCHRSFEWPLPTFRSPIFYGYITHYKEMGHQKDSMEHCIQRQPAISRQNAIPLLPLPDYLESDEVLSQIRMDEGLKRWRKRLRPVAMRQMPRQCSVEPLYPDLRPPECAPNVSYGCVFHAGLPQLWVTPPCHDTVLRCHKRSHDLVCGRRGESISVCTCSRINNVESLKHWVDGNERFLGRERIVRRRERQRLKQRAAQRKAAAAQSRSARIGPAGARAAAGQHQQLGGPSLVL